MTSPGRGNKKQAFYADIDQPIMEAMMDEMAARHPVDGVPTSLRELGYLYVGLDDHWQNCTRICSNGTIIPSWDTNHEYDYSSCAPNNTGSRVLPWYALAQHGTT